MNNSNSSAEPTALWRRINIIPPWIFGFRSATYSPWVCSSTRRAAQPKSFTGIRRMSGKAGCNWSFSSITWPAPAVLSRFICKSECWSPLTSSWLATDTFATSGTAEVPVLFGSHRYLQKFQSNEFNSKCFFSIRLFSEWTWWQSSSVCAWIDRTNRITLFH